MLIQVKDLEVYYEKAKALSKVSLFVEEGEIITIIGRNGAGKSTILKCLSGLVKASSGEIHFDGKRIDKMSPQRIVGLGIAHAPEGRRVFRDLSVLENLKIGAYLRKDNEVNTDIDRIYQQFSVLSERKTQQAGKLSGGEQQMLGIARALMSRPKLLLLDEPSLGLSPKITAEIAKIVTRINEQNKVSIILVEQNSQLALRLSHRGYVLEVGNIILEGKSTDLIENRYVKEAYLGE